MSNRFNPRLLAVAIPSFGLAYVAHAQSASEDRPVAPFSRLSVQGGIDVHLTQSDRRSLTVEVDGYDLEDVVTEVRGDELVVYREGGRGGGLFGSGFFDTHEIDVYLDFVQLSSISASGGSDVHGRNRFRLDDLTVEASGGSDVELDMDARSAEFALSGGSDLRLRGSAGSLAVEASGGSDVAAGSFDAERARLVLSGGSDASVRATAAIDIEAHGGSDVTVHGDPAETSVDNDRSSDITWR